MAKKEDFYHELDTKAKRSFCTCQTLALGCFALVIIVVLMIFLGVRKIKTAVAPERKVIATGQDALKLRDRVEKLNKAAGASTVLVITEQELTALLIEGISKQPEVPIRDLQAEINPDGVVLTGTATKFLSSSLTVTVLPKVVDGKPVLELVKIKAGTLTVPKQLTEALSETLAEGLKDVKDVKVKSVTLGKGKMTISGIITSQ